MSRPKRPILTALAAALAFAAVPRTPLAQSARTDAISHTGLPSIASDANAGTTSPTPDVTVTTPVPPAAQELSGDSLSQFIAHHATVRYVTLPFEAHGYAARETLLHILAERINWFDKYVKNAGPRATTEAPQR